MIILSDYLAGLQSHQIRVAIVSPFIVMISYS